MSIWSKLFGFLGMNGGTAVLDAPETSGFVSDDQESAPEDVFAVPEPDGAWWRPMPQRVRARPKGNVAVDRSLIDHLTAVLRNPDLELPKVPHVVQRALGMQQSTDVDFKKLAQVFEADSSAVTEVLRVVNSPAFRGVRQIDRLEFAFARLGHTRLHNIVLGLTLKGLAIKKNAQGRSVGHILWERALASGTIMGQLGPRYGIPEESAFLVGLLHDIGNLAILRVVHDYQGAHGRRVPRRVFEQVCREWHGHIGVRLAEAWNLPDPLPELIGQHHQPPAMDDPLATYRHLIQFADATCDMLGYGEYVAHNLLELPCTTALQLGRNIQTYERLLELPEKIEERVSAF